MASMTATQLNNFRYRDGMGSQVGYYLADNVCANILSNGSMISQCTTPRINLFGASFFTEKYAPFQGLIGLGPGSSGAMNTQFLSQFGAGVKNSYGGAFNVSNMWSFLSGPFMTNKTSLFIGGV